ncbi:MAG TPA: ABC transporter permease [Acidimicrobiia bacterium]|nr:ABC transporter permease [Acidimicrobiia bacterium]
MSAVMYRFRVAAGRRWIAWTAIGLLAGAAVGVVMVAAAGARRTGSSLDRIIVDERASDVFIGPQNGLFTPAQIRAIKRLPQVSESSYLRGVVMTRLRPDASPDPHFAFDAPGTVAGGDPTAREFGALDRPRLIVGRLPSSGAVNEILVSDSAARSRHLAAGSVIEAGFFDAGEFFGALSTGKPLPAPRRFSLTITGIAHGLDDATRSLDDPRRIPRFYLTPALARAVSDLAPPYEGMYVRLRDHGEMHAFEQGATKIIGPVGVSVQEADSTLQRARRETRPFVLALWLFALLAAFAATGVVAQTSIRQQRSEATEHPTLRAIGFTRREMLQHEALRAAFIGIVAAAVAVVVAIGGSLLMPIGPLRALDPHTGIDLDVTVLALGIGAAFGLLLALHMITARRRSTKQRDSAHLVGDALARAAAPVPLVAGVRFALDRGRGDRAIPLRSTLLGVTLAIAALVTTVVYGAGLTHFTKTPRLYGWVWDFQAEPGDGSDPRVMDAVKHSHSVMASAVGYYAQPLIDGKNVPAIAVDARPEVQQVSIISGRSAEHDNEIVLGADSLHMLGRHVGDHVSVTISQRTFPFTIVGTSVFARFAPYPASSPTGLGVGAAMTVKALRRFGPVGDLNAPDAPNAGQYFMLVKVRPGTSMQTLTHEVLHDDPMVGQVLTDQRPNDLVSYDDLRRTPLALVGLLVVLALVTTSHLLVSAVRSRRRDFSLFRAIGFTRDQLRLSILAQATTLVVIALVVAVPTGVVAGRLLWTTTANWLGIPVEHIVPVLTLVAIAVGTLAIANLLALVPAIGASRVRPADWLRSE